MSEITITGPGAHLGLGEIGTYLRGELRDAVVQLDGGPRFKVSFLSGRRLQEHLAERRAAGQDVYAEPGLIVLSEVTNEAMAHALGRLWREGFFDKLKPEAS
jgi:hypothetical protein